MPAPRFRDSRRVLCPLSYRLCNRVQQVLWNWECQIAGRVGNSPVVVAQCGLEIRAEKKRCNLLQLSPRPLVRVESSGSRRCLLSPALLTPKTSSKCLLTRCAHTRGHTLAHSSGPPLATALEGGSSAPTHSRRGRCVCHSNV